MASSLEPLLNNLASLVGRSDTADKADRNPVNKLIQPDENARAGQTGGVTPPLRLGDRYEAGGEKSDLSGGGGHPQRQPAQGLGLLMGRVSLELSYTSLSAQVSGDGFSASLHHESLKLDFSFLRGIAGADSEKTQAGFKELVDSGVLEDFASAVGQLNFFDDASLEKYNKAAENLFTKLEETLGLDETGLDHVQNVFQDQVRGFFDRVQADDIAQRLIGGNDTRAAQLPETTQRPDASSLRSALLRETGRLLQAGRRPEEAADLFRRGLKETPNDPNLRRLFDLAQSLNDRLKQGQNPDKGDFIDSLDIFSNSTLPGGEELEIPRVPFGPMAAQSVLDSKG